MKKIFELSPSYFYDLDEEMKRWLRDHGYIDENENILLNCKLIVEIVDE